MIRNEIKIIFLEEPSIPFINEILSIFEREIIDSWWETLQNPPQPEESFYQSLSGLSLVSSAAKDLGLEVTGLPTGFWDADKEGYNDTDIELDSVWREHLRTVWQFQVVAANRGSLEIELVPHIVKLGEIILGIALAEPIKKAFVETYSFRKLKNFLLLDVGSVYNNLYSRIQKSYPMVVW